VNQFHGNHRCPSDLLAAVNVNDIRMIHRRRQPPLAKKPFAVLVGSQSVAHDLQRDAPPSLRLLGLVDLPHAPLPQQPQNLVSAEHLTGNRHLSGSLGRGSTAAFSEGWRFAFEKALRAQTRRGVGWQDRAATGTILIRFHKALSLQ